MCVLFVHVCLPLVLVSAALTFFSFDERAGVCLNLLFFMPWNRVLTLCLFRPSVWPKLPQPWSALYSHFSAVHYAYLTFRPYASCNLTSLSWHGCFYSSRMLSRAVHKLEADTRQTGSLFKALSFFFRPLLSSTLFHIQIVLHLYVYTAGTGVTLTDLRPLVIKRQLGSQIQENPWYIFMLCTFLLLVFFTAARCV